MSEDIVKYGVSAIQTASPGRAINQFLAGQLSPSTKRAYQTDIQMFFTYARITPDDITTMQNNDIYSLVTQYRDNISKIEDGTSFVINASTVARKLTAINTFFGFMVKLGMIDKNPVAEVRRPSVPTESTSEGLTLSELKSIFSLIDTNTVIGKRDKAILNLMFYGALRRSEVAKLQFKNIQARGEYTVIHFIGKRNKVREIPLTPDTLTVIKDYVRATGREMTSDGFIFLSYSNRNAGKQNISAQTIFAMLLKYTGKAGINKRISPHSFRHTAVTIALDNNASYRDVMNLTGHSDARLVKRYDRGDKLKNNATWKLPAIN